ncbi:MAG: tetratricopeptide repeat protein [Desulfovibrio sp.]|nr:tetratricopeptide repeat protein [Desulfovibrio sp.]
MNIRKIREDLGRVRTSCQRRDVPHGLYLLISSLKELGGQKPTTDLRADFREAVNMIASDPEFKAVCAQPLIYKPGSERELLGMLIQVYQTMVGKKNTETYEEASARKLRIDHSLRDGKKFLSHGRVQDAETCFAEAIKNYKDENALFLLIARAYIEVKEVNRAIGYLREGLKKAPQDPALRSLADECLRMKAAQGS